MFICGYLGQDAAGSPCKLYLQWKLINFLLNVAKQNVDKISQINNLYRENIVRKRLIPQHELHRNKLHHFDQIRAKEF